MILESVPMSNIPGMLVVYAGVVVVRVVFGLWDCIGNALVANTTGSDGMLEDDVASATGSICSCVVTSISSIGSDVGGCSAVFFI